MPKKNLFYNITRLSESYILFLSKYAFLEQQFKEQLPQICGYDRPFERTHLNESMSYEKSRWEKSGKSGEINKKIGEEELHAMKR